MEAGFYKTGCFTRSERVKQQSDIQNLFKEGKKYSCRGAKLFVLSNGRKNNRIVFSLSRKYGIAVTRNHSKRVSREAYRFIKNQLKTGYDMLLLVYPGEDTFFSRYRQLLFLCMKANLIIKSP